MNMFKVTGLYTKKDKNGNKYLTGRYNYELWVSIFKNDYKDKDTDPDSIMYFSPVKHERKQDQDNQKTSGEENQDQNKDTDEDEDIPF